MADPRFVGKKWTVNTAPDDPLNMREAASARAKLRASIPTTRTVESTGEVGTSPDGDTWLEVIYKNPETNETKQGWVNSRHLREKKDPVEPAAEPRAAEQKPEPLPLPAAKASLPPAGAFDIPIAQLEKTHPAEAKLLSLINTYRDIHGLPAWKVDSRLLASSRAQVAALAKNQSLQTSDSYSRIKQHIPNVDIALEEISAGRRTPEQVMKQWLDRGGGRDLLHPVFTAAGVARAEDKDKTPYWVLDKAARKDDPMPSFSHKSLSPEQQTRKQEFLEDLDRDVKKQQDRQGQAPAATRVAEANSLRAQPGSP